MPGLSQAHAGVVDRVGPSYGEAQAPAGKVYRVGFIGRAPDMSGPNPRFNSFRQELTKRGYVEGQNLVIELRSVEGRTERVSEVVGELVCLNVAVIVAVTAPTVQAARQATRTIPIVMFGVGDPVSTGFVASLARPGGNITGPQPGIPGAQRETVATPQGEIVPAVSRVAILWNPTNPSNAPQIGYTKTAAQALGLELHPLEVRGPQDLESAFHAATRGRAGALMTLDDLFIYNHRPASWRSRQRAGSRRSTDGRRLPRLGDS